MIILLILTNGFENNKIKLSLSICKNDDLREMRKIIKTYSVNIKNEIG